MKDWSKITTFYWAIASVVSTASAGSESDIKFETLQCMAPVSAEVSCESGRLLRRKKAECSVQ